MKKGDVEEYILIDIDKTGGLLYLDPKIIDVELDLKSIVVEPKIRLIEQSKLIDIRNIPMLEYSELFREDKNPFINAYADAIMGNYSNV